MLVFATVVKTLHGRERARPLMATSLSRQRIRILPPVYNHPYNLHPSVPAEWRANALNDVVCIAYEERSLDPDMMTDIYVDEPLKSWLSARTRRA